MTAKFVVYVGGNLRDREASVQNVKTMMNRQLELGMSFEFEGREYIILSLQTTLNRDGRSLVIHCYEPLLAMKFSFEADQRREAAENMTKAGKLMERELGE